MEWGPKVRVNAINVGLCRTEQTDDHYGGDATVRAIESEAERRLQGALVEELSEKARDRWADVLRRLGE